MIPLFIWILCPADIVYLIKIDILGSRIKVMKKWCLRIFIWRYKGICLLYSPHMWRWSQRDSKVQPLDRVFSTHVEVILSLPDYDHVTRSILHTCGGDPLNKQIKELQGGYSPHMWRWSRAWNFKRLYWLVFSTHVEVIPVIWSIELVLIRILHTCGGDPNIAAINTHLLLYSPHMWRWSCWW